jgi:adenylate cyclase
MSLLRWRRLGARLSYWIIVTLAILLATPWTIVNSPERSAAQNLLFDEFQRWRPRLATIPSPVRVVEIDDESLTRLGRWPWPRAKLARMIEKLTDAGAAVVALDIVLDYPGEAADDATLAAAIVGRPVVLGQYFTNDGNAPRLPEKAGFAFAGDDPTGFVVPYRGVMAPLPAFVAAAAGVGFLNWLPDNDRVVRRVPLVATSGGRLSASFAMETLRVAQGASTYTVKASNASGENAFGAHTGIVAVRNGDAVAMTGPRGDIRIHFARDEPSQRLPAWRLFEPGADLSGVKGQIVLIGVSAELLYDIVATPLSPDVPGVRQHAQILEQIVSGDSLSRPDWAPGAELLYTLSLSALLAVLLPFLSAMSAAGIGFVAATGSAAGSWLAYSQYGLLLDPILPTLCAGIVYLAGQTALFARKQGEARDIRQAFGRYVAPAVVARLAADPSVLRLGGEERRVTLMFCDLRSFTTLSEGKSATELTHFLNEYLTPMTDEVLAASGTVDKYIGDAIMAFWNAPLDDPAHARHSVEAALGMRAALARLNMRWSAGRDVAPVRFGVGLNTGAVCVGNLGSLRRFDYSVIGDEVNVAARLESATKMFGVDIAATEATRAEAPEFAWLEVDQVVFKNKTVPVGIYALAGDAALGRSAEFAELAARHALMMELYRARNFAGAGELAQTLAPLAPAPVRGLYAFQQLRFAALAASEPPPAWSAVLALEEK